MGKNQLTETGSHNFPAPNTLKAQDRVSIQIEF